MSKVHNGGLTSGYQKVIIGILSVEDVSATCLLLKNQTPERQYFILKEKIQSLFEEATEMSIRFNQTPLSQTSLITIPSSLAPSKPVIPPDPTAKEEVLQTKINKVENDVRELQKDQEEEQEKKELSLEEISLEEMERMSSEKLEKMERKLEDFKERIGIEIQERKKQTDKLSTRPFQ